MKGVLEAVEREENLYCGLETVREFAYLYSDCVSAGGCEVAMTATT